MEGLEIKPVINAELETSLQTNLDGLHENYFSSQAVEFPWIIINVTRNAKSASSKIQY
uniref:hypothetical protein n=1 Tax=Citrobacter pasteurii TaxID=1563222 RepID=UPI0015EE4936|nr:hypothetical protein [Citrobacter pasteurii]